MTAHTLFPDSDCNMSMPQPPGFPKPPTIDTTSPSQESSPKAAPSVGAVVTTGKTAVTLTITETQKILNTTLDPEHRTDPNILNFISRYLICRDAKQAAVESGLNPKDGMHLKRHADIHLAITQLTDIAVQKYNYDAHEVVEKMKEIVFIDPIEYENRDGTYKSLHEMTPEARRAIKKIKAKETWDKDINGMPIKSGRIIELEFWDKMKGAELLGREKDIFKETKKVQHDITRNMADTLLESKKRAEDRAAGMKEAIPVPYITIPNRQIITEDSDDGEES